MALFSINMYSQVRKFSFLLDGTSDFVVCITPDLKASDL